MTATKLLTNDCRSEFVNSDGDWLPRSLDSQLQHQSFGCFQAPSDARRVRPT